MEGIRGELSQPRGFPCSLWKGRKSQNKNYTNKYNDGCVNKFLMTVKLLNELSSSSFSLSLKTAAGFQKGFIPANFSFYSYSLSMLWNAS